ncbi:hypothetical protein ACFL0X_01640 [Nanoarchaeota archaeon]
MDEYINQYRKQFQDRDLGRDVRHMICSPHEEGLEAALMLLEIAKGGKYDPDTRTD